MNWDARAFDWNQARAFLATAEHGSLSGAARALKQAQPTLGRQVAALEASLGVLLFDRVGRSLKLTSAGVDLLEHVQQMADAANRFSMAVSGQTEAFAGQVSVTASDAVSAYLLPPILKELRASAPEIEIEVIAANDVRDLRRREADIAIRHVRPTQPELIARHIGDASARLYASSDYLDSYGRVDTVEGLADADFIALGTPERMLEALSGFGAPVTRANIKLSTGSGVAGWEMVRQGLGMTLMADGIALTTEGVEAVLPEQLKVGFPVWLVTHRELRTSRRIRVVFDTLADALAREEMLPSVDRGQPSPAKGPPRSD